MKRSVGLFSGQNSQGQPKKKRLISVFSALKNVLFKPSLMPSDLSDTSHLAFEKSASENEEIPNSFISRKRRMSINDNIKRQSLAIPRSSVSAPSGKGMVEMMYDSAQSRQQSYDVDGEFTRLGANPESQLAREISPSVHVPKSRSLPRDPEEGSLRHNPERMIENPMALEFLDQDIGSIYEDDASSPARPPFINLNPRERHHLLQMKKSIEASEFLQSRLYMTEPDESMTILSTNNKVDSFTQTETSQTSLKFNALRTKLALQNRKHIKSKKSPGFFSGEFIYDPAEIETPVKTEQKFQGILASVKKPQFPIKPKKNSEKSLPDDESRIYPLKRRGSLSQRPGLEEALRFGKSKERLDDEHNQGSNKSSTGIRLKKPPVSSDHSKVGPTSAFKFDIQKDKVSSIFGKRQPEIDTPMLCNEKTAFTNQTDCLGKVNDDSINFALKDSALKSGKDLAPDNHLTNVSGKNGVPETALFPQNNQIGLSDSVKQPLFSFGTSGKDKETPKPAFSFGGLHTKGGSQTAESSIGKVKEKAGISKPLFQSGVSQSLSKSSLLSKGVDEEKAGEKLADPSPAKAAFGSVKSPAFASATTDASKGSESITDDRPKGLFNLGSEAALPKLDGSGTLFGQSAKKAPEFDFEAKPKGTGTNEIPSSKRRAPDSHGDNAVVAPERTIAAQTKLAEALVSDSSGDNLFSFGKKPSTLSNEKSADPPSESTIFKSKVDVGTVSGEAPKFSFGKAATKVGPSSTFSFGQSSDVPKSSPLFSFSASGGQKANDSSISDSKSEDSAKKANSNNSIGPRPGMFGGQTPSSEPTPIPSFSFGNPTTAQQASANASTFSFGQTATADPASIFGAGRNAPASGFNFAVAQKPTLPQSVPSPAPFAQTPGPNSANGFSFSNTAVSALGGSRSATPSNSGFGFGANSQNGNQASNPAFGGFSNPSAPSSVFGGTSRSVTPTFGGFGQPQNGQFNTGQPQAQPQAQSNGFSFTNNSATGTMNSAPGSFGQASRESTPPAFGNPMGGAPPPGINFTGRKLAHMRPRRR